MKYRVPIIREDYTPEFKGSITQLAKVTGIDRGWLSKIINNKEITTWKMYVKIKAGIQKLI